MINYGQSDLIHQSLVCQSNALSLYHRGIACKFEPFKSSPYFYSKKYLKHFITELIEVELKVKVKLKVAIMILPTLRPSAAWGSQGWTVRRGGLERYF